MYFNRIWELIFFTNIKFQEEKDLLKQFFFP